MQLNAQQKRICEQVLNAFETGSAKGNYSKISVFRDGPNDMRQVTYGRSQTTEFGNLRELVVLYVEAGGTHSEALRPFVPLIKNTPLANNETFKQLLRDAGKDPVMRLTQDEFFDKRYFKPARKWAKKNGFTDALSMLVIYDSFVHSGSILGFLRSRFAESPPAGGGKERKWISEYVRVRHSWLANHSRTVLRNTIYRTRTFKTEIGRGNWNLSNLPVNANGVMVSGEEFDAPASPPVTPPAPLPEAEEVPFLGDPAEVSVENAPRATVVEAVGLETIRDLDLNVDLSELGGEGYRPLAREIQDRLIKLGFLDPPVDGDFGPLSRAALQSLQEHDPLPDTEVINATLAGLLLSDDLDRFLPVEVGDGLAGRIYRYMRRNDYFFAREPGALNIVYLEGADQDGTPNDDRPNHFNDRRLVLGVENGKLEILGNWEATTEPGRYWTVNPMNSKGAARIKFGQYKAWSVGKHHPDKPGEHEALVQSRKITVHRDLNQDFQRTGDRLDTGLFYINQHWGYDMPVNDLGRSSAGCLVGRTRSGHRQFMSLIKSDVRYQKSHAYRFVTTVIDARSLGA